jgi:hypothetical protein
MLTGTNGSLHSITAEQMIRIKHGATMGEGQYRTVDQAQSLFIQQVNGFRAELEEVDQTRFLASVPSLRVFFT